MKTLTRPAPTTREPLADVVTATGGGAAALGDMRARARAFALGPAGDAFDASGALVQPAHAAGVQAVVDQVLWAATRLVPAAA